MQNIALEKMIEAAQRAKPLTVKDIENIDKEVAEFKEFLSDATKVHPEIFREPFTI